MAYVVFTVTRAQSMVYKREKQHAGVFRRDKEVYSVETIGNRSHHL